jgi:cobalt/nickel transport system permease protein
MHIADGILPAAWCGGAHALAYPLLYWSARKAQPAEIVKMGLLASALFAVSLVHIPVAGMAIHVGLLGLAGILLGARSLAVVFPALLLQALLFQHGGLLALGVNTLNMSAGALLAGLAWRASPGSAAVRGFAAGFTGVAVPAGLVGVEFALAGYGKGFLALAGLYSGVAVLEGLITSATVGFLSRTKPAALEYPFLGHSGGGAGD